MPNSHIAFLSEKYSSNITAKKRNLCLADGFLLIALLRKRLAEIARVYVAERGASVQRCLNIVLIALGVRTTSKHLCLKF